MGLVKVVGISFHEHADPGVDNTPGMTIAIEGHPTEALQQAHLILTPVLGSRGAWRITDIKYSPPRTGAPDSSAILTVTGRVKPEPAFGRFGI